MNSLVSDAQDLFKHSSIIAGIDEAGRGPLAGPVCAAAVILPSDFPFEILRDSKKLSQKKREFAEAIIKEKACFGIALVDNKKIDEINILQATMLAMRTAFEDLLKKIPSWCSARNINCDLENICVIVDGNKKPLSSENCVCVPKADAKYFQVMAASILAKTCRDRIMIEMDKKYPQYGYARHKGYPTSEHRKICRQIGPSPIQRLTFSYQKP